MIINGELTTGPRRRRLPGLDDRLQRRLRGRPEDHRADEPRALHQPLPAGPRRDRQLPGRRPEVRQRHRALAAAAHVRRLVLARRSSSTARRSTGASRARRGRSSRPGPRRSSRCPTRRSSWARPPSRRAASPRSSTSVERKVYTRRRRAALRQHLVLVLPRRAAASCTSGRSRGRCRRRRRARAGRRGPERPDRADRRHLSAAAISSASQAGTRVGRCVVASTQAWRVQPSATASPSRSTE